ncbi:MAG: tetratricopeptide repeat protein [Candidatus Schekmanbacteria bacterium]|nr:tetratricopeptide repeat protein [Candidatus Schekmanbacteria bacterium]
MSGVSAAPYAGSAEHIGPYRLAGMLGRGGFGIVYRGVHAQTGQAVALKTLLRVEAVGLWTLRREIHALMGLRHPAIVRILDQGVDGNTPWYAMELLDGEPLNRHCASLNPLAFSGSNAGEPDSSREHGGSQLAAEPVAPAAPARGAPPLPPEILDSIAVLGIRLAEALSYLHGEGIVHRDLKPGNIVIRPDGTPVLVDFGFAAHFATGLSRERLEVDGLGSGSILYMAPEQIRAELSDTRADLYSLGCILHELIVGQCPFVGRRISEVLDQHLHHKPEPLSVRRQGIPQELDEVVARLLAKNPRDRYGYAEDVALALAACRGAAAPLISRGKLFLHRTTLVGREQVLISLSQRVAQLRGSGGGVGLLLGECGVGKTRMLMELARHEQQRFDRILTASCPAPADDAPPGSERPVPLGVWREIFRRVREQLDHGEDRLPVRSEEEEWVLSILAPRTRSAELQYDAAHRPESLPPGSARMRLFFAMSGLLARAAEGCCLLVLLDDLQWADEVSIDFLRFLIRSTPPVARDVTVLAAVRTESLNPSLEELIASRHHVAVQLDRLDQESVCALVADMLSVTAPPPPLVAYLHRHSEGNPFFVAEYLRAAVESRLIDRAAGAWNFASALAVVLGSDEGAAAQPALLPVSVREIIERRLRGLGSRALEVARAAAVLGREVWLHDLSYLVALDEGQLHEAITELLRRSVLEQLDPERLGFAHETIREIAYEAVAGDRKRELHRLAAAHLEVAEGRPAAVPGGLIAHHWELAGERERASEAFARAAREAESVTAIADAIGALTHAIRLREDGSGARCLELLQHRARLRDLLGEAAEAASDLRAAVRNAAAAGLPDAALRAQLELANVLLRADDRDGARAVLEAASPRARACGGDEAVSWLTLSARRAWKDGDVASAEAQLVEALAFARGRESRHLLCRVQHDLALVLQERGRFADAVRCYREAAGLGRSCNDAYRTAIVLGNMGTLFLRRGMLDRAERCHQQALRMHVKSGDRFHYAVVLGNIGTVALDRGEPDRARTNYDEALKLCRQMGNDAGVVQNTINIAFVDHEKGEIGSALQRLTPVVEQARTRGSAQLLIVALYNRGSVLADLGRFDLARQLLAEAAELCRKGGDRFHLAEAQTRLGEISWLQGRFAEARALLGEAHAECREIGYDTLELLTRVWLLLAEPAGRGAADTGVAVDTAGLIAACREHGRTDVTVAVALVLAELAVARPADAPLAHAARDLVAQAALLADQRGMRRERFPLQVAAAQLARLAGDHRRADEAISRATDELAWLLQQIPEEYLADFRRHPRVLAFAAATMR